MNEKIKKKLPQIRDEQVKRCVHIVCIYTIDE